MELPQPDVVFRVVVPHRQPIAVRLDVEQDSRSAVGLATHGLELDANRAVGEIVDAAQHGHRIVGKLLGIVHQLFVACAVELARGFEQQPRGIILARDPGPAVHHDDFLASVLGDHPRAHHGLERFGRFADLLLAQVDLDLGGDQRATQGEHGKSEDDGFHENLFFTRIAAARVKPGHSAKNTIAAPLGSAASGCPR